MATLSNTLYYNVKPYLPRPVRLVMRRWWTRRRLAQYGDVWPIRQEACSRPEGWPGWPEGKQFAFVLTHDVEGAKGLGRVRDLAKLEQELGFRSSFNFIPEGEYQTPRELREELTASGFEVGVHDLRHDGKLYRTRGSFAEQAGHINRYLKDWNAVGFRSGFMLRNLSWLGDLNIKYDASTFDTDPFEPQPDGANTIFPFWVSKPKGDSGYIELPYTLPQDSTVFNLLRESTIDIWKRKLDWVAQHGGLALLNVHPDYVSFHGPRPGTAEYSSALYREFLEYAREKYKEAFWHALPREVAAYCEPIRPRNPNRAKKRVAMLAYTFYDSDNRVRRYAESLARRGDAVDIIALRPEPGVSKGSVLPENINHFGLQRRVHNEKNKFSYLLRLLRFCAVSGMFLARATFERRYDLIHVHNIPDFLVFAAIVPRIAGSRIILDIHDVVPEFYSSKFAAKGASATINALKKIERHSCRFADHVIISNHLWFDKITARSIESARCTPFVNHVDPGVFYRRARTRRDGKFVMLFPGGLQWHQGLDLAIKAFGLIREKAAHAEFHIYGEGNAKQPLLALIEELGLAGRVRFFKPLSLNEIAEVIANADLGVVPKRADSFGNEAYSTKIMEFMSQGVPVIVSKTKIDSFYFNDDVVRFFESGNIEDLADAMLTLIRNQPLRELLVKNSLDYVAQNSWARKEHEYFNLVDSLTA